MRSTVITIPPEPTDELLFAEACDWFARLGRHNISTTEQEQFKSWLQQSPQHAEAWAEVQHLFVDLAAPAKKLRQQEKPHLSRAQRFIKPQLPVGFAVRIFAMALLLGGTCLWQGEIWQNVSSDYYTVTGEQRRLQLADGSVLWLNTDTAVTVDVENIERKVNLLRGEVFFEVAHAPSRPFYVDADGVSARVTGTAFSVHKDQADVLITVSAGRVETSAIQDHAQALELTPGKSVLYHQQQLSRLQGIDIKQSLAWRNGQMVFVQTPLEEVVAQINRYRPGRLLLVNPELRNHPVTAVFTLDKLDEALNALEKTLGLRAQKLTPYLVLLG